MGGGRREGIQASNDHVVWSPFSCHPRNGEPHINVLTLFGDHFDYESQGTFCGHQFPFNCEGTHVDLANEETSFLPWDWPHLYSDTSSTPFLSFPIHELNFWVCLSCGKKYECFQKILSLGDQGQSWPLSRDPLLTLSAKKQKIGRCGLLTVEEPFCYRINKLIVLLILRWSHGLSLKPSYMLILL